MRFPQGLAKAMRSKVVLATATIIEEEGLAAITTTTTTIAEGVASEATTTEAEATRTASAAIAGVGLGVTTTASVTKGVAAGAEVLTRAGADSGTRYAYTIYVDIYKYE